jgi:hypothetical protein
MASPADSSGIGEFRREARSAITNGSRWLNNADGRSTWVRRAKDVLRALIIDLGGDDMASTAEAALARRCAVLVAQAEMLEQQFAAAEGKADIADLDAYLKTANTLRRLLQTLGLQRRAKDIGPTLGDIIRADHLAQREQQP